MSDVSKASVKVEIAGEEYTLRTNADESYTIRCAALVNDRMEEIHGASGLDRTKTAIMAALSLSDDVLQERARLEEMRSQVAGATERLADRLDQALKGA
ncbi:MAG: cell division protein ZapA [Gemmatimonadetes bacterium]|nr:cell division protein ZapA [Gemmatimonadota bacterium]